MGINVQNFEEDVITRSHKQPVIVDFWAPWCGPCRVLGPVLDKLAGEQAEKWELAKINTDENKELSARYGIKGIPAVKMFVEGEVVGEFTGSLPEKAVRQWIEKVMPSPVKNLTKIAESHLDLGERESATVILEQILKLEPTNPTASGLLAGLLVFSDSKRALELAAAAGTGEPRSVQIADAVRTIAQILSEKERFGESENEAGAREYRSAVEALRANDLDRAMVLLIEVLQSNRYVNDDGARKLGVAVFTLLGPQHPVSLAHRRTFDMWLY